MKKDTEEERERAREKKPHVHNWAGLKVMLLLISEQSTNFCENLSSLHKIPCNTSSFTQQM